MLAERVRHEAGERRLPVNPFRIAQALGLPVEEQELQAEGVLVDWPGSNPRIVLRRISYSAPMSVQRRRRFTLAHEIGHFVIRENLRGLVSESRFGVDDPDEERLCNAFAAELLMPRKSLLSDVECMGAGAAAVLALCEQYCVSLKALLSQVQWISSRASKAGEHSKPKFLAAIWSRQTHGHVAEWTSPSKFHQIVLCDSRRTSVERAFSSHPGIENRGRDSFLLGGRRMRWQCTSVKLSGSAKVLMTGFRSLGRSLAWAKSLAGDFTLAARPAVAAQPRFPFLPGDCKELAPCSDGGECTQFTEAGLPPRVAAARSNPIWTTCPSMDEPRQKQLLLWPTDSSGNPSRKVDWW